MGDDALDIAIRDGLIVDGTGLPAFRGDIGVKSGRIVSVGTAGPARSEIDARGLAVSPGFVDPHTHFDAQLLFDPMAIPIIEHGVTTVVTGNCSLSLAPIRRTDRARIEGMFQVIEEMPEEAFESGVHWQWGEEFGALAKLLDSNIGLNVAPLVGHSAIRMFVMGDDAQGRTATSGEVDKMANLLRDCLQGGAIGMSTSYIDSDRNFLPVPSRWAAHAELEALCAVLGEQGRMLQIVHEYYDPELTVSRVEMLAELSLKYKIPTTLSPLFHNRAAADASWQVVDAIGQAWAKGARVWVQVQTRPVDICFSLSRRGAMFLFLEGWWDFMGYDHATKQGILNDPRTRQPLVDALNGVDGPPAMAMDTASVVVREVFCEGNRRFEGRSLGDIAQELGSTCGDALVDLAIADDLRTWFVRADLSHDDSAVVGDLLLQRGVHVGASDAGAHIASFATYGDTGMLISKYVRDLGRLSLEEAVKRVTMDACTIWGIPNRGQLCPGYAADITLFDPEAIDRGPEERADDFPGGMRWIRRSVGVDTVLVNGEIVWRRDEGYTKTHAGRVVSL